MEDGAMDPQAPREALERELYWRGGPAGAPPSRTTVELRERLEQLAHTLRRDAEQAAPWGDPAIAPGGRWRRVKIVMHRLLRPVSRRYDRITAELAQIAVAMADALLQAERDVRRLEEEVLALGRDRRSTPEA